MKILFIHQNFPGQFKFLAPALAQRGHQVYALTLRKDNIINWQGVTLIPYSIKRSTTKEIHPWVSDIETKVIRGEACFRAGLNLRAQGLIPDVIIAHPGWGESLFLKEVWPQAKLGMYCEFFYHLHGADVGFDPEFPPSDAGEACRVQLKNLNNLLHFEVADAGLAPTQWQASTFPINFRDRITVIHDGIDTQAVVPNPAVTLTLNQKLNLTRADEIITFVNRNLEPYRGCHIFFRALPEILRRRPQAQILIAGKDGLSYGAAPKDAKNWLEVFMREVRPQIPDAAWARVHFVGHLPYPEFIGLLQISRVHIYLTYPFVLSWSLLEAMSVGCAIVGSDTPPVREVIQSGETGYLVDFFDIAGLINIICDLLNNPQQSINLGKKARELIVNNYDLKQICLPRQLEWVEKLKFLN